MYYGIIPIIILLASSVISCDGSPQANSSNNNGNVVQLKPSNLRQNEIYYRSAVATQDYAYVAVRPGVDGSSGVIIYPLSGLDLNSNQTINEINYVELNQRVETLAIHNNILFAGGSNGVKALDITNPETPVELFSLNSAASTGIKIYGNLLFTMNGLLKIHDITDPYNPIQASIITKAGFSAAYSSDILYASSTTLPVNGQINKTYENSKIHVIDITDPFNPNYLNEIQLSGEAYHLEILNNYLVAIVEEINTLSTFLQVYALTDKNNPVLKDELVLNSLSRAFGTNSNYGVVSSNLDGLIFEIDVAGKIKVLKNIAGGLARAPDGFPYHTAVQTDYAIIPGHGHALVTPLK